MRRMTALAGLVVMMVLGGRADEGSTPSRSFEEESVEYYDLVVTASRVATPLENVGSSVTVITAKDLEDRRNRSVLEALRAVPGIQITTAGGPGTTAGIRIRGANDVHTLVLIDGIRVHSATQGTPSIQNLTIDNIERIEIVRGPQSVLYGSDAMGGVIQIFTKKGTRNRSSVAYEGGTFGTHRVNVATQGLAGNQSYSVAGSWQEVEGFSRFSESRGGVEDDGYRNKSASLAWQRFGWLDLGATLLYSDGEIDLDETTRDNRTRYSGNREWGASLDLSRRFGERWRHSAKFTGFEDEQTGNTGADYRVHSVIKAAKWQSEFFPTEAVRLIGGFESEKQIGASFSGGARRYGNSTITNSGFIEGLVSFREHLHLTLGGRHDHHSSFGDHQTWRTTAAWTGWEKTRVFGSYGTGFRAPTFNQLYFPGYGTPTLKPEESRGWDAGLERRFGSRARLRATWFGNRFEELIQSVGSPIMTAQNVARARTSGVEVDGSLTITPRLELTAHYTYTDAENELTNKHLQRQPRNSWGAHLAWNPVDPLSIDAYYKNVGPSYSADAERNRVAGYDLVSAVVTYRWRERHKIWVRGENLFDTDYEEVTYYGTPGAAFYGGYEVTF